ncbi:MAG: hypothetical protein U1D55_02020 [Phycisphaerae bacterium]
MKRLSHRAMAAVLSIAALVMGLSPAGAQTPPDAQQEKRLATFQSAGAAAALTIYPVEVLGKPSANVADALGLVLEKSGMTNLESTDAMFTPDAGAAWADIPSQFAKHLAQTPPKTTYALYAQYLGDPKSGPTEVRWAVADVAGNVVLVDRQTPTDKDFVRTASRDPDPMGCSVLVAERVFSLAKWKKSERSDGKFARKWAEKSGTPSEADRTEMGKRLAELKKGLKSAKLTVYATRVNDSVDAASATRLAALIAKELGCQAAATDKALPVELAATSNEMKRLWDLARGMRDQLRTAAPTTDYALLSEFIVAPGGAHSVHFVICTKGGDWVIVDFQNNQHDDFQRIAPKNVVDCERLAVERMAKLLR